MRLQSAGIGYSESGPSNSTWGAFIAAMAVVFVVITYGYFNYARVLAPDLPSVVAGIAALVVFAVATLLAKATADARLQGAELAHRQDRNSSLLDGVAWFLPLLAISALGAMNALFFTLEGDDVVTSRAASARADMVALTTNGEQALRSPPIEDIRVQVKEGLGRLEQRIKRGGSTPNSCGIGRDADLEISALAKVLPGYRRVPRYEGVTNCSSQATLLKLYEDQAKDAWQRFVALPIYRSEKGAERDALIDRLQEARKAVSIDLKDGGAASQVQLKQTREQLKLTAATYAELRSAIQQITGKPLQGPATLDIDDALTLGNAGHVIKNLFKRWDHVQSWFYILVAVVLDIWFVFAFKSVMRSAPARASRFTADRSKSCTSEDAQVHYLWDEAA